MNILNSFLAGVNRLNVPESGPPPVKVQVGPDLQGSEALPGDVFEQGRYWKNNAVAKSEAGAESENRYALQAYIRQQENGGNTANHLIEAGADDGQEIKRQGVTPSATGGENSEVEEQASKEPFAAKNPQQLNREELAMVAQLQKVDARVRAHEMAHVAAAGGLAKGGASFQYQKGPDGKDYAVAGEVQIDTGRETTPEATLAKMARVRSAALAPADPSPQDRKVASSANQVIAAARQELEIERLAEMDSRRKMDEGVSMVEARNSTSEHGSDAAANAVPAIGEKPVGRHLYGYQEHSGYGRKNGFELVV